MDIIKVVYFAFVMCLINGYDCSSSSSSSSSNGTIVITDHDCTESYTTIVNNTRVQYEPVTYNYVLENEDIIMELLSEGQKVMLSEYGEIRKIPMPLGSCYNLSDSKSLRGQIQSTSEQPPRPSQDCINRKYWETVAVTAPTCGCFPFHIFSTRYQVNELYCMSYDHKNTNNTGTVYGWIFTKSMYRRELNEYLTSCHVLSRYIVRNFFADLYSRFGLLNNGTVCTKSKYKNESKYCTPLFIGFSEEEEHDLHLCVPANKSNDISLVKNVVKCQQITPTAWNHITYVWVSSHMEMTDRYVYYVFRNTLIFLYTYNKSSTRYWKCVTLFRKYGNLFVDAEDCDSTSIKNFICRKTTSVIEHYNFKNQTSRFALITASVIVFISLVVILGIVARRVVRIRFHQDASTPHGDHGDDLDNNTAIELNSIGSSDDGSGTGPVPFAGSVPGSHDGSAMGPVLVAGSVSGRTDETTAAQSTTCDAVPGRTSRGYNFHYAHS